MIITARPDRRWVGHLLDQKGAAGFARVFADHIERQSPANAARAHGILRDVAIGAADFESPQHRDCARRIDQLSLHQLRCNARHLNLRTNARRIVICARLLHMRREHKAFGRQF